jgi:hypothetical protein
MSSPGSRLVVGHRCIFCAKVIRPEEGFAGILVHFPRNLNRTDQVEAHLECLRSVTHPEMAARLDESVREDEDRRMEARMRTRIEAMPWWRRWRYYRRVI